MIIFSKKLNWIASCILILTIVPSCKKFLTRDDPSNLTVQNYYKSAAEAESAVNSIYSSLLPIYKGAGWNGVAWEMLEFATGEAKNESPQAIYSTNIEKLNISADNGYVSTWWNSSYRGIANANQAIAYLPKTNMDDAQKKNLLAQARFLRAYYYFNLVRIFGKVPLITKPQEFDPAKLNVSRDSVMEIYNLIVSDLTMAEQSTLPFNSTSGRVTLGAIKSLLASVYLTIAGYPLRETKYYKKARDKAKEVIDSHEYHLFQSYNDLHDPSKNNTSGFIFEVQYSASKQPNARQEQIIPYEKHISAYSNETGSIYAATPFVESYELSDKRRQEKQFFFTKFTSESNRNEIKELGHYYLYKFFDVDAQMNTVKSGLNIPILRYAEVLLIFAEAENEVSGPTTSAYQALNSVRNRANLPSLSDLSQSEFREAAWREEWHELCYENKTWFNMVRLRQAFNPLSGTFEAFVGHKFATNGATLSEKNLLFPIPSDQIRIDKNLTQNPGY